MAKLEILIEYNQLFCPTGSRCIHYPTPPQFSLSDSEYISGSEMSLEKGLKDINHQAQALEELSCNLPQKDKFWVGLKNCETIVAYVCQVKTKEETVANVKEVLTHVFALPPGYKPRRIHLFPPYEHVKEVESWLNSTGKTMLMKKDNRAKGIMKVLLKIFASDARYGLVNDL